MALSKHIYLEDFILSGIHFIEHEIFAWYETAWPFLTDFGFGFIGFLKRG